MLISTANGLKDGDEVHKYKTDPLKADTDGDGINDGDEIKLGLNPLNPKTNGTPDSKRLFHQTIRSNDKALQEVNTKNNPYQMSVSLNASGCAADSITAGESPVANVVKNNATLGIIPKLEYSSKLEIGQATIQFKINKSQIPNDGSKYAESNPEYKGLKRFNIFKYCSDINMLMPIETSFDMDNDTLYATVDQLGTYCVIDMEKWFSSLGIKPEQTATIQSQHGKITASMRAEKGIPSACSKLSGKLSNSKVSTSQKFSKMKISKYEDPPLENDAAIDVVFVIYANYKNSPWGSSSGLPEIKDSIYNASKAIFSRTKSARLYVVSPSGNVAKTSVGSEYSVNPAQTKEMLDHNS